MTYLDILFKIYTRGYNLLRNKNKINAINIRQFKQELKISPNVYKMSQLRLLIKDYKRIEELKRKTKEKRSMLWLIRKDFPNDDTFNHYKGVLQNLEELELEILQEKLERTFKDT